MATKCSYIKSNQISCKRSVSLKTGHDPLKCWQHQPTLPKIRPKLRNPYNAKVPVGNPIIHPGFYCTLVGSTRYPVLAQLAETETLGEGELDLAYRDTDPDPKAILEEVKIDPPTPPIDEIKDDRRLDNLDTQCQIRYRMSMVTFEPIDLLPPGNIIVLDDLYPSRCIIVSDYISFWRYNLTVFDPNTRRVKPQYPRDIINNEIMKPIDIYKILNRGIDNQLVQKHDDDPLWYLLKDSHLVTDLYNFIMFKSALEIAYDRCPDSDLGAWNRRDLVLIDHLTQIYHHNHIPIHGWRYYTNIRSARQAVMVFESCVLVGKLIQGFSLKLNPEHLTHATDPHMNLDYHWVATEGLKSHDLIGDRDPTRAGVNSDIVTANDHNIFLT